MAILLIWKSVKIGTSLLFSYFVCLWVYLNSFIFKDISSIFSI